MRLVVFTEPQLGASYTDQLRVAQCAEELGFDAFFRSDHYLHIPGVTGGTGEPGSTDAWITLAGLARETSRIRLGTLLTPVTFRLPGPLAISVAQVDVMSGGRVELGLGASDVGGQLALLLGPARLCAFVLLQLAPALLHRRRQPSLPRERLGRRLSPLQQRGDWLIAANRPRRGQLLLQLALPFPLERMGLRRRLEALLQ